MAVQELAPSYLRAVCDVKKLGFKVTSELPRLEEILGQKRAIRAMEFGMEIEENGFNIYVAGPPGTGRTTTVKRFLEELAERRPVPSDWCYVSNFRDPYQPKALELPAGKGREFVSDMEVFVEDAHTAITRALESEEYAQQREEINQLYERRREAAAKRMKRRAQKAGFLLRGTQAGLIMVPLIEGKPATPSQLESLPAAQRHEIEKRREVLEQELRATFRKLRALERKMGEDLRQLERKVARYALEPLTADLKEKYAAFPPILGHLEEVEKDILEHLGQFIGRERRPTPRSRERREKPPEDFNKRYKVNLIVDNAGTKGAPVVIVTNPTYPNLFGRIDKEARFGALVTDFSMIRPGALHRANGGYLVLPIRDLLLAPLSYNALKRALQNNQLVIEDPAEQIGLLTVKTLRPEPIPLNVKVIAIGDPIIYHQLYALDPDFRELFKVKADFDTTMDRNQDNIRLYGSFVCALCEKENLRHLTADAVAEVVDYSSRLAEDQAKLSTRFAIIADIIREANFYARSERKRFIGRKHIKQALEERVYRSNLLEEKIREMIQKGLILIDTDGEAVGQVNGLTVISLGDFTFGRPARVTASVAPGRGRVIDIERESKLGGPIHTKGVLILSGYLAAKYGRDKPLSLSARLVFEQSYSWVEGDSASSTELYALLSALSGVPIQQRFAVTGSVNQQGEIQAIGGVNEKIEGFFEVCKARGLTGKQGVLIPKANVQNLMLKEEVVEAVRAGKFHIYPVETVDEGIEILTGLPAGKLRPDGTFPPGTINALVDERLRKMASIVRNYYGAGDMSGSEGVEL